MRWLLSHDDWSLAFCSPKLDSGTRYLMYICLYISLPHFSLVLAHTTTAVVSFVPPLPPFPDVDRIRWRSNGFIVRTLSRGIAGCSSYGHGSRELCSKRMSGLREVEMVLDIHV